MLLRFSVENYRSFRDRAELSMVPSRVRSHPGQVVKPVNTRDIGVLKTAVIYGANASGKSNLIKAMQHARTMIVRGNALGRNLAYEPFLLDRNCLQQPSRFEFEIKYGETNYAYGFVADQKSIHEEWLYRIDRQSESPVFERTLTDGESHFDFSGIRFNSKEDEQFLAFTAKATPDYRLFLYECLDRNVVKDLSYIKALGEVNDWFHEKLNILFPDTKYHGLEMAVHSADETSQQLSDILKGFDTGIESLALKEVDLMLDVPELPENLKQEVLGTIDEGDAVQISGPHNTRYQVVRSTNGVVQTFKLMTSHLNNKGEQVQFDINQESDGTQRLLDIAPGLLDIFSKDKVYIVDEIDRSLHPEITTSLLNHFLSCTEGVHSQLIMTTHESNLLNLDNIRRDEIWFTQKERSGSSSLYSLEEYQARPDKDIRKGYLVGRYGGLPMIGSFIKDQKGSTDASRA
ncbi:abortive phage infection protein [Endozoicomonas montiporae]|uniref:Abortive phage infection protein n=3 Tax=Endozoicomonas montiporae TaxID=1027273 RepID=A0A081NBR1_9GAMM|nr:ATP-binding protein [Endozoicomonas montiporae]AMO56183.1 hypothetical protein EZMO1_2064 [Endozoicomonas montiporae CL-33]KEQ15884.1 abortive phage infection protein [Endozoicomonas montiporae]